MQVAVQHHLSADKLEHVQRAWRNAQRLPAVMCFSWRKEDIKRVEEGKRQREGGEMGHLSEAPVRGISFCCQFLSFSSMLTNLSQSLSKSMLASPKKNRKRMKRREEKTAEQSICLRWQGRTVVRGLWVPSPATAALSVLIILSLDLCRFPLGTLVPPLQQNQAGLLDQQWRRGFGHTVWPWSLIVQ